MVSQKFVNEMVDNLTKKEIAKYKSYKVKPNEVPDDIKLSDGTKVKKAKTNLDKMSVFNGPWDSKEAPEAAQMIGKPKFVADGRLGYTTYVEPILKNAQEEMNRGV